MINLDYRWSALRPTMGRRQETRRSCRRVESESEAEYGGDLRKLAYAGLRDDKARMFPVEL